MRSSPTGGTHPTSRTHRRWWCGELGGLRERRHRQEVQGDQHHGDHQHALAGRRQFPAMRSVQSQSKQRAVTPVKMPNFSNGRAAMCSQKLTTSAIEDETISSPPTTSPQRMFFSCMNAERSSLHGLRSARFALAARFVGRAGQRSVWRLAKRRARWAASGTSRSAGCGVRRGLVSARAVPPAPVWAASLGRPGVRLRWFPGCRCFGRRLAAVPERCCPAVEVPAVEQPRSALRRHLAAFLVNQVLLLRSLEHPQADAQGTFLGRACADQLQTPQVRKGLGDQIGHEHVLADRTFGNLAWFPLSARISAAIATQMPCPSRVTIASNTMIQNRNSIGASTS